MYGGINWLESATSYSRFGDGESRGALDRGKGESMKKDIWLGHPSVQRPTRFHETVQGTLGFRFITNTKSEGRGGGRFRESPTLISRKSAKQKGTRNHIGGLVAGKGRP